MDDFRKLLISAVSNATADGMFARATDNKDRIAAVLKRAIGEAVAADDIKPIMTDLAAASAESMGRAMASAIIGGRFTREEGLRLFDELCAAARADVVDMIDNPRIAGLAEALGIKRKTPDNAGLPYIDATGAVPDFSAVPEGRKVQCKQRDGTELSPLAPGIAMMLPWAWTESKAGHEIVAYRVVEG